MLPRAIQGGTHVPRAPARSSHVTSRHTPPRYLRNSAFETLMVSNSGAVGNTSVLFDHGLPMDSITRRWNPAW